MTPSVDVRRRRAALATLLTDREIPAMVVSSLTNIRYLTGFTGSNAQLLMCADGRTVLGTDGRYREQVQALEDIEPVIASDPRKLLDEAPDGWACEHHELTVEQWESYGRPPGAGRLVESLRIVKDDSERSTIETACQIASAALAELVSAPLIGVSERDIAVRLERLMIDGGADDKAFDTIVATGPNSAIPHHEPTDRAVAPGDLLKIDFGAKVCGYHSDITRTFVAGPPKRWQQDIHQGVLAAQEAATNALAPGVDLSLPDSIAREVLGMFDMAEHFTTGLGHGVGLQIHEDPFFTGSHLGKLCEAMVVTIEPGVYLPGRGGVRIEDTIVVGHDGPTRLNHLSRELMEIN